MKKEVSEQINHHKTKTAEIDLNPCGNDNLALRFCCFGGTDDV